MLKLVGAVFILFAGTAFGFAQASRYARRPKELRQLAHALTTLESEIVYGVSPLPSAFARVATAVQQPVSRLFAEMAERLERGEADQTVEDCWQASLRSVWPRLALGSAERDALLSLRAQLGVTDRADQAKHLRLVLAQLTAEELTAREEQARYEKMWRSAGLLAALLVVILLY